MISAGRAGAVALAGLLLILTGLAFATPPLLVPGVAFTAVGLLAPAVVVLIARGSSVTRHRGAGEVVEGRTFTTAVVVRAGRLGLPAAELADPLAAEPRAVRLPPGSEARELSHQAHTSFPRRGRVVLPAPALRIRDPLALATVERRDPELQHVLVLPRTEPVAWRSRAGLGRRHAVEHGTMADALAASEIDGLRPYRPGTPASRIHWPAVARGAGLLERRMRAELESTPLVVLDARCPADQTERLDAAVRAAASLLLALARRGGASLLSSDPGRPLVVDERLSGWATAHARLALVTPATRPPVIPGRRRASAIVYVAAAGLGRLPEALQEAQGALVLPAGIAPPARLPVTFEVAGCVGFGLSRSAPGRVRPKLGEAIS